MNNLEQFKQSDNEGGFYQFKFEWVEKEDEIAVFDFVSGNSSMEWKQRQHMLEAVNTNMQPFDIVAANPLNWTDVIFDGLSWSDDHNFHIMFDGILELPFNQTSNAGKQSRNLGWEVSWAHLDDMMSHQKFYSVGALEAYKYAWPLWMGGWISESDVGHHYIDVENGVDTGNPETGVRIPLFADYQRVLFRSPKLTTLKIKDLSCL